MFDIEPKSSSRDIQPSKFQTNLIDKNNKKYPN